MGLRREQHTTSPVHGSIALRCGTWWRARIRPTIEGFRPGSAATTTGPRLQRRRALSTFCSTSSLVRHSIRIGRDYRWANSASPPSACRQPPVHRGPRNTQLFSQMCGRPTNRDKLDNQAKNKHVGTGVSGRHKDLLGVMPDTSTPSGGPPDFKQARTQQPPSSRQHR